MDEKEMVFKRENKDYRHTCGDVIEALSEWVIRVAGDKTASDKEIEKLPEVVYALVHVANRGKSC